MKKLLLLFTAFIIMVSFVSVNDMDGVISSLKSGNASQLSNYFDNTVEISFPEKSGSYSKNQAKVIITDFFSLHQVKKFEILHKGDNFSSQYFIGTLTTKNGVFRTTIYLKQRGNDQFLQEIRFDSN